MKTLAIMMMLLFVAGSAFGVYYQDSGTSKNDPSDLGPQDDPEDYFQQSGMIIDGPGVPPSDPIMEDSTVDGRCVDSADDWDQFAFEVGDTFTLTVDASQFDLLGVGTGTSYGANDVIYTYPTPGVYVMPGLAAGWYNMRIMNVGSGGGEYWSLTIDGDFAPPVAPIPEPAGLGLVGLALLAVRKRRS